jgi:hypothetical protein
MGQHGKALLTRGNSTGDHDVSPPGTFGSGLLISGLGVRFPRGAPSQGAHLVRASFTYQQSPSNQL